MVGKIIRTMRRENGLSQEELFVNKQDKNKILCSKNINRKEI